MIDVEAIDLSLSQTFLIGGRTSQCDAWSLVEELECDTWSSAEGY